MIEEIETKISDKTLSKWCKITQYRDSYRWNEEENLIVVSQDTDNLICFNWTRYRQSGWSEWIIIIHKDAINDDCYNIIWHPISLARVLSALDKLNWSHNQSWYVYFQWEIYHQELYDDWDRYDYSMYRKHISSRKLLNEDNTECYLDGQDEQTIKSIYNIIIKNEKSL